jgi:transposase
LAKGKTREQVAQFAAVHPVTVGRWLSRYRQQGLAGLRHPKQHKRGRRPKLLPEQLELVKRAALTPPRQLGKPFAEWTLRRLACYLAQQTGVSVRFHYLGLLLRRMGVLRHGKTGFHVVPELVVVWFFIAGMRYQKDRGAKEEDRVVIYGGLNLRNGQLTTLSSPNTNVASFLRFLNTLLADYPDQKILLIAESDSFRKTVKVEVILKSQQGRLEIHSFSPNPVHLQDMKRRWGETKPTSAMNFLFNSLEDLTGSLRKGISALKEVLAQQGSSGKLNLAAKA